MGKRYSPLPHSNPSLDRELREISVSINDILDDISLTFITSGSEFEFRRSNSIMNVSNVAITLTGCKSKAGDDPSLVPYGVARIVVHNGEMIAVGDVE